MGRQFQELVAEKWSLATPPATGHEAKKQVGWFRGVPAAVNTTHDALVPREEHDDDEKEEEEEEALYDERHGERLVRAMLKACREAAKKWKKQRWRQQRSRRGRGKEEGGGGVGGGGTTMIFKVTTRWRGSNGCVTCVTCVMASVWRAARPMTGSPEASPRPR